MTPEGRASELALSPNGSFPHPRVLCDRVCSVSGQRWHCSALAGVSISLVERCGWLHATQAATATAKQLQSKRVSTPALCLPLSHAKNADAWQTCQPVRTHALPRNAHPPLTAPASQANRNPACTHLWTQAHTCKNATAKRQHAAAHKRFALPLLR